MSVLVAVICKGSACHTQGETIAIVAFCLVVGVLLGVAWNPRVPRKRS